MKRLLLIAVLFAFAFSAQAQDSSMMIKEEKSVMNKKEGPMIEFENETIDYGTIAHNADGNREFVIKNTGTAPLLITKTKGSCGCTVPKAPKDAIMPGETDVIKVRYATNRVGKFTKTVTVTSNAVNKPTMTVRIKGEVLPAEGEAPVLNMKESN
ncbi:MAG: DUF1573 domain-containing protein [Flavobacteriaceae bacterium]|nr:DUF1573 domain-containing protein [Flavobacteriaceae bacterium]